LKRQEYSRQETEYRRQSLRTSEIRGRRSEERIGNWNYGIMVKSRIQKTGDSMEPDDRASEVGASEPQRSEVGGKHETSER
jgi:hypothetical protein